MKVTDARRSAGEKACAVVNFNYGYEFHSPIWHCVNTLGTTQGCDAGTHGIPLKKPRYLKYVRSFTIKDGVIVVEMDALGEDGRPLVLATRSLSPDTVVASWELSGSAFEACERYRLR